MNSLLLALFLTPAPMVGWRHMLMLVPLSLAISIVYKTLRIENLRDVPLAAATLCVTILGGMYAVGVCVWLVYLLMK
jgi:hypothetical protein